MNTTQFSETVDLPTVGNLTNNFTGADMKALVRKAGLHALKDNRVGCICCYGLIVRSLDFMQDTTRTLTHTRV
jgi:ATP-dependent 26S proteasome regulatory subunit